MSTPSEPTLTDVDREQWRLHVAGERAWLAKFPGFPLSHAILAVAERLVWLEAERERLYASDETNQARVMHILGIVDGLKSEREQLVRERDEARAEVEQMHARADHATVELLALGRELKQAREERDRAVAEAAVLREALGFYANPDAWISYDDPRRVDLPATQSLPDAWTDRGREARFVLNQAPLAARAAAVLAAAEELVDTHEKFGRGEQSYQAEDKVMSAVDAYRAALAGESEVPHG